MRMSGAAESGVSVLRWCLTEGFIREPEEEGGEKTWATDIVYRRRKGPEIRRRRSRVTREARTNRTRPNPGFLRQSAPAHRRARPLRAFPLALKKQAPSCFLRMSSCSQHIQVFAFYSLRETALQ